MKISRRNLLKVSAVAAASAITGSISLPAIAHANNIKIIGIEGVGRILRKRQLLMGNNYELIEIGRFTPNENQIILGEEFNGHTVFPYNNRNDSLIEHILKSEKDINLIENYLQGANIVITAGMDDIIGSYIAPFVAEIAKRRNVYVAAVVSMPFKFAGRYRVERAMSGLQELKKYVDACAVIDLNYTLDVTADITKAYAVAHSLMSNEIDNMVPI